MIEDLTQADRHVSEVTRACEGFFCLLFCDFRDAIDILIPAYYCLCEKEIAYL